MTIKLSIEDQEALDDLLQSPALPALWLICDEALTSIQDRLLASPLSSTNEKQFLIDKARADGAAVFLQAIKQRLTKKVK